MLIINRTAVSFFTISGLEKSLPNKAACRSCVIPYAPYRPSCADKRWHKINMRLYMSLIISLLQCIILHFNFFDSRYRWVREVYMSCYIGMLSEPLPSFSASLSMLDSLTWRDSLTEIEYLTLLDSPPSLPPLSSQVWGDKVELRVCVCVKYIGTSLQRNR